MSSTIQNLLTTTFPNFEVTANLSSIQWGKLPGKFRNLRSLLVKLNINVVLHLEFQTQPDAQIDFRMADYRLRGYRRYPNKEMRQVVIYLKPTRSPLVQQTVFAIPRTRHEFEVIRLWEQPQEDFLQFPGLFPLAILSQTEDKVKILAEVAQKIENLPDRRERSNVTAVTAILAGLVLDKELIRRVLREEIMRESVIYQEIVAEAIAKGKAEGIQEGKASLVIRLLRHRIGKIDSALEARIRALSVAQLEVLGEAMLDFLSENELLSWLENTGF